MYAKCQHLFCFNKKCLVDKLIKCGGTDVLLTVYNVQDVFRCLFQSELPPNDESNELHNELREHFTSPIASYDVIAG